MVRHLHKNFLIDPAAYAAAEQYWIEFWETLVGSAKAEKKWTHPWLGNPLKDGNPIFSAVSTKDHRGVRIIQHGPQSEDVELTHWTSLHGEKSSDAVLQLTISCSLSEESGALARDLVWSWVTKGETDVANAEGNGLNRGVPGR